MFNTEIYIQRRKELKNKIASGILLFLGNGESPMNFKDNTYHFRQDSSFLYYFGINEPEVAAVIDTGTDEVILFGEEMSIDEIVWMGRQETLASKGIKAGISEIRSSSSLKELIDAAQKANRKVHFLPPYRAETKIKLLQLLDIDLAESKKLASVEFIKAVVAQRSIKSAEEVEEIEKAVNVTVDMHLAAMQITKPGISENRIAAAIHEQALIDGGNLSYPIILTIHGEILHNHYHGNIVQEGQLVLNDSGAETAMGYCGDLTRTFPAGAHFTEKQKEIYAIVLFAHEHAVSLLKPGTRYLDIHLEACKTLTIGLKNLGLMKGDVEEAVRAGAHAMFFQCGTGHMMGLDVHDMEDLGEEYVGYNDELKKNTNLFGLKSLRLGRELEEGFVITIEPGIYFIPELMDIWKAENKFEAFINYDKLEEYRNFGGIRIEENFLITADKYRLLGKPLAKTINEIELIRSLALQQY